MLYNGFNVGVFFKNRQWVDEWLNSFVNSVDHSCIYRVVKNGLNRFMIELKDGTCIRAFYIDNVTRGHKFDKVFVEPCISDDVVNTVIMPLMIYRNIVVEHQL